MRRIFEKLGFKAILWLYGLIAAFVSGGASAVGSGIAVMTTDIEDFNFQTSRFWVVVVNSFVISGVLGVLLYIKQHPMVDIKTLEAMIEEDKDLTKELKSTIAQIAEERNELRN